MSSKMNLDACVGWLGEVSIVAGKLGILRHLATSGMVLRYGAMREFFGYACGLSLESGVKLCSWEVNEVLHYVGWQVPQNGDVLLMSMILAPFSYMSY